MRTRHRLAVILAGTLLVSSLSGCGYIGAAIAALTLSGDGGGGGAKNQPPSILFTIVPSPSPTDLFINIDYDLIDPNGHSADIVVEFSIDGGVTYTPATEGPGGDGTFDLAASRTGVNHIYVWNFFQDLFNSDFSQLQITSFGVALRLTATDEKGLAGTPDQISFRVGNLPPAIIVWPVIVDPLDSSAVINYTAIDDFSDPLNLIVEYSLDGFASPGQIATPLTGSATCLGTTGIPSSPIGVPNCFEWDYPADITGAADPVVIRIWVTDSTAVPGLPGLSGPFRVGNDPPVAVIDQVDTQFGVGVDFRLIDSTSDTASVSFEYSTNDGMTYTPSTNVVGSTTGLASSPQGVLHDIAWNSLPDIGTGIFIAVRVRIAPSDPYATGGFAESSSFTLANSDRPYAFISAPLVGEVVSGPVQVDHLLVDFNSDPVDLVVEYRTGASPIFAPATEVPGPPSEGVTNLTSSVNGVSHVFVWDSLTDLGPVDVPDAEIRITPSDASGIGTAGLQGPFRIDNNGEPIIQNISTPLSPATGNIALTYDIVDPEGDPTDIRVQFSIDAGLSFSTFAHEGPGGDGTLGLASSPGGTSHVFVWDSALDLGLTTQPFVVVRITPSDNPDPDLGTGTPDQTAIFAVDNNPATAPPTIQTVSPSQGPPGGLNPVIITGTGFIAGTTVQIGAQPLVNPSIVSVTTITGDIPPYMGPPPIADVTVTSPNGSATLPGGYTYAVGPTIVSVTPNQGNVDGGDLVTIAVQLFQDDFTQVPPIVVQFGTVDATGVTGTGPGTFTCITPRQGAPGFVDVYVEGESGDQDTLVAGFEYISFDCTITSIAPTIGGVTGGTLVTIDGTNFRPSAPPPIVTFDGLLAAVDPATTDTQIICTTPPGLAPGPIDVAIFNSLGGACLSAGGYTYDTEGILDTSFDGRGIVLHNGAAGGGTWDVGNSVAVEPSTGRVLVTGSGDDLSFAYDMVIWAFNPDGSLDTSFNGQGFVTHNDAGGGNADDQGAAILLDTSGRILVAGSSDSALSLSDMAIWRYDPTGTLDPTFNAQGWVTHNNAAGGDGFDSGLGIALDGSGRILVAGYSRSASSEDMAVWRYNPDGTLDTTFNGQGWVVYGGPAGLNDRGQAITLDGSGRILVAGHTYNAGGDADLGVWRYDPAGTLDPTFGTGGVVIHDSAAGGGSGDSGRAIAIDAGGAILIAGSSRSLAGNDDMVVWRLNPDGSFDSTFGGVGWVIHTDAAGGAGNDYPQGITLDAWGRIIVAGYSRNVAGNDDMVIWRFDSTGSLDLSFAGQGFVVHNNAAGGNNMDLGLGLTLDREGRIVVVGQSLDVSSNAQMTVWRYLPDGTIDAGFDPGGGLVVHDILLAGPDDNEGLDVVEESSGRILATGYTWNQLDEDMSIWAINPDGSFDLNFNSQGWVTHDGAAGGFARDAGLAIAVDPSGWILVTGESDGNLQDMVVWRFDPFGILDTGFGLGGVVVHDNAALGNAGDVGTDIVIEGTGRILVCGYSAGLTGDDMVIWALNPNGTFDLGFNSQGWVTHDNAAGGTDADQGLGIAVDGTGRILVSGWSFNASFDMDMVVWAFDTFGALDNTFNGQGWVTHDNAAGGTDNDIGNDIAVDAAGRILVAGQSVGTNSDDMVIWAYNPDGTLDTGFNSQGWVVHDSAAGGLSWDIGNGIALDGLGRIVVAGYSRNATPDNDMVIWRYDSTGALDPAFGTGGFTVFHDAAGGNSNDEGSGIALDSRGRILVTGTSLNTVPNLDLVIWRYK